jgi:hypothetical protein
LSKQGTKQETGHEIETDQVNGVFIALVTWQLGHPKKKDFFFLKAIFFVKENEGPRK